MKSRILFWGRLFTLFHANGDTVLILAGTGRRFMRYN